MMINLCMLVLEGIGAFVETRDELFAYFDPVDSDGVSLLTVSGVYRTDLYPLRISKCTWSSKSLTRVRARSRK